MEKYCKIITPFLMGQRRDGLLRVCDLDTVTWKVCDVPDFIDTKIEDSEEKIKRLASIYSKLSELVKEIAIHKMIPVSIAGDCVSSLGVLAGLQKAGKQPDRILWLDAHGDFHTWETSETKYIGGMPLAMLVGRGDQRVVRGINLEPYPENQIVLSNARDLDAMEKEPLHKSKISICKHEDVLKQLSSNESLYVHWDTDFVDAKGEMPALKYHVGNGPSYKTTGLLFEKLASLNIVAVSVSAWHEEKDLDNKTAIASIKLLKKLGINMTIS